jgi:hypothetical protein
MTYVILSNKKIRNSQEILENGLLGFKKPGVCETNMRPFRTMWLALGGFMGSNAYGTILVPGRRKLRNPRNANVNRDWH